MKRPAPGAIPGITVTRMGQTDLGGGKSLQFSIQEPDLGELARLSGQIQTRSRQIPGMVTLVMVFGTLPLAFALAEGAE